MLSNVRLLVDTTCSVFTFSMLQHTHARMHTHSQDGFVVNALGEVSVGLCRGNCVLYTRSLYALALGSGNAFRGGAGTRTSEIN